MAVLERFSEKEADGLVVKRIKLSHLICLV